MRQNTFANTLTRGLRLLLSAALLAGLALALRPAPVAQADTFTVDSTGDGDDVAPGDGTCADAGGNCTLRAAIMESNALAAGAPHTIAFNVGGGGVQTISPGSALPMIARPVTIDGTTQPGYAGSPIIELDGSGAGAGADGLHIVAGNSTVRGLVIHSFDAVGVALRVGGGNFIEGNYIGTDATGTVDLGNSAHGVIIWSAPDNTVGGMTAAQRNVISGNNQLGVYILGSDATGNQVLGNYIGTAATGTADLGNTLDGVHIHDAPDNTIGGTAAGAGNVISGNDFDGVVISSNGATGNQVLGNYIGTDAGGSADLGNTRDGVCIEEAPGNTIGGTAAGARNVISGNDWYGVWMRGSGATGNQVLGNYIGTDAGGSADLGNSFDGVYILEATDNTIGGTAAGAGNVISGNDWHGVMIAASGATGNQVLGNYIGTDATGSADLGNTYDGVHIWDAPGNTIGGTAAGARNVISGNGRGVHIWGNDATGNQVQGNYIGTDAGGSADLGNSWGGVFIYDAPGNTIGGTAAGARNVISGNYRYGVCIWGSGATGNQVLGNFIGTDVSGTLDRGNDHYGVFIGYDAQNNTIGGMAAGARNTIAFNSSDGMYVETGIGNGVLSNAIFSNGGLGIDLGDNGVTLNDDMDGDAGPNNLQNFPVLTSVTATQVQGTLNSVPNRQYRIEVFVNNTCDQSNYGEGESFGNSTDVTTDGAGNAPITIPVAVGVGQFVTATATDLITNDTSEFSMCIAHAPDLQVNKANDTGGSGTVGTLFNWTLIVSNTGFADATFTAGQRILEDDLPVGPTYGPPVPGSFTDITDSANISCTIAVNTLTCGAQGGSVTIGASTGRFDVVIPVTPNAIGLLSNPAGNCGVDPDNDVAESSETNNSCADSVNVAPAPRPPEKEGPPPPPTPIPAPKAREFNCWPWLIIVPPGAAPNAVPGEWCQASLGQPLPAASAFRYLGHSTEVTICDAAGVVITQFVQPIKVCFRYTQPELDAVGADPADFLIQVLRDGKWQALDTRPEDSLSHPGVCAPVDHLTLFALFARDGATLEASAAAALDSELVFPTHLPETGAAPGGWPLVVVGLWLVLAGGALFKKGL